MLFALRLSSLAILASAVLWLILAALPLRAQETQTASEPAPSSSGFLGEIGKLLKSPAELLPSFNKPDAPPAPQAVPPPPVQVAPASPPAKPPATAAAPPAAAPTPAATPPVAEPAPAAPTSTRLFPGMASGRESCPLSASGGPDCQAATDKLCQSKGYKSGRSLATDSAYTCNVKQARAEGRKPCGTEYFVTSAFCN